ncbi:hypothetical protein KY285_011251 [Solanum tuberosum]|nr:hypothetical protein KY289_011784 [Solanum tuberosum]KAH0735544.1 hypothetical protein KY285_011251 [Solanum tuberosum]
MAAVGKLVWQLACKEDTLWIKWVHGIYMKDGNEIWTHNPPADSSWYWRKLNSMDKTSEGRAGNMVRVQSAEGAGMLTLDKRETLAAIQEGDDCNNVGGKDLSYMEGQKLETI